MDNRTYADNPWSLMERARKKMRTEKISREVGYMDPIFLPPMKNICERLVTPYRIGKRESSTPTLSSRCFWHVKNDI